MALLVELKGIDDVLPDAVQASGDGGHWRHIGISQPDQEAGVLLAWPAVISSGRVIRWSLLPLDILPATLPTANWIIVQARDRIPIRIAVQADIPLFIKALVAR